MTLKYILESYRTSFILIINTLKNYYRNAIIPISIGISLELVLVSLFYQSQFIDFVNKINTFLFEKPIIALLLAIISAWIIASIYNKRNKPMQNFWETQREETKKEIKEHLQFIRVNLRTMEIEKNPPVLKNILDSFQVNMQNLFSLVTVCKQYLTLGEIKWLTISAEAYGNYYTILRKYPTPQPHQLEKPILESQKALTELIISFESKNSEEIERLIRPISDNIINEVITAEHNWCKFMIGHSRTQD